MEKKIIGTVGFDVITLTGFKIESGIDRLKEMIFAEKKFSEEVAKVTNYGSINIKENIFQFERRKTNLGGTGLTDQTYTRLTLHAANETGENVCNMDVDMVWDKIQCAINVLFYRYGLAVSVPRNEIEIRRCEINRTFVIEDVFSAYNRILNLVALVVLDKGGKKYDVSVETLKRALSLEGMKCEKRTYAYRFYDKSAEMMKKLDGVSFNKKMMRAEIIYKDSQPIITDLGTTRLAEVTDEMIKLAFEKRMLEIKQGITLYLNKKLTIRNNATGRDITVPNIIRESKNSEMILAAIVSHEAVYGVPCLLDYEDIEHAFVALGYTEHLKNDFLQICHKNTAAMTLLEGQRDLMEEFFQKLIDGSCETVKMYS